MVIDVKQTVSEKKNTFDVLYNDELKYTAMLPFFDISGVFGLEKLRDIHIFDENNNEVYTSKYNYLGNKIEEFIPLKYLATNSQKFNQYAFNNNITGENIFLFFQETDIWDNKYIIKTKDKVLTLFSVEKGEFRHITIYNENNQIAEFLKPNIQFDGKDNYKIYLLDNYSYLSDALMIFCLYLDMLEYSSSYLKRRGVEYKKTFSYSKANDKYDDKWLSNNFDVDSYLNDIHNQYLTSNEYVKSYMKKILLTMGIIWLVILLVMGIILLILHIKGFI